MTFLSGNTDGPQFLTDQTEKNKNQLVFTRVNKYFTRVNIKFVDS